uniref:Oligoendopeptidase F n=1 Tax=uncultured organism TaxID=155900 RepID=M1Q128_9ZZZZ|nr:oligoendopeptidase F [uncultured organism]
MEDVQERSELEPAYRWNLSSVFSSDQEWKEEFEAVEGRLEEFEEYSGRLLEDGETLLSALKLREEIFRKVDVIFSYAKMKSDEDTRNQEYQAMSSQARGLYSSARSACSFIEPELQSSSREEIAEMVANTPELEPYEHYFDDVMRLKPHTRSAEVEEVVADLEEVLAAPGEIYNYLTNADIEFPTVETPEGEEVKITLSNFVNLLKREDREFRHEVYDKFFSSFDSLSNTISVSYENSVKSDNKLARIRNYDSARESSLNENNIPLEVYDNLVEVVEDNLDSLHRHAELKRKALGYDELKMWDLYTPMSEEEIEDIPYEEAQEYVLDAVEPLGEDYKNDISQGFDSRWIDVYETPGKRAGAYSGGAYDTQPFILMNYQGDVSSLYTLAHELGHSMHSKLTSENQPYVYGDYSIFVAEVASTTHEALLTEHLLEEIEDPTFRVHVLDHFLEIFRSTLYRQTLFADFEHRVHEMVESGEGLNASRLKELYGSIKRKYYEPAEVDEKIEKEWMRIPHFYRAYYVYQYSTGVSAALALSRKILEGGESARENYLGTLKSGSSKYPLKALRDAGVDMSQPDTVSSALSLYDEYLDEMEELI